MSVFFYFMMQKLMENKDRPWNALEPNSDNFPFLPYVFAKIQITTSTICYATPKLLKNFKVGNIKVCRITIQLSF